MFRKILLGSSLTIALSVCAFASNAFAMPTLAFNEMPADTYKVYEGGNYTIKYDLTGIVEDVAMKLIVKGPVGDPAYGEAWVASDSLIMNGTYSINWDGKFSGIYPLPGTYEFSLTGKDLNGNDTNELTGSFAVTDEARITDATADATYSSGTYEVSYHLDTVVAACVDLYVDSTLVNTEGPYMAPGGDYVIGWDGLLSGMPVGNGSHDWSLLLESTVCGSANSDIDGSGSFTVGGTPTPTPTPPTPPPASDTTCSGFTDVQNTSPLCPAITYVKTHEIFSGYPDGTFRPYDVINRAETTKVILLGFGKTLLPDDESNLGFSDVEAGAWYMTYLRTAKELGIIQGYPDGTVKPGQQVNRAELLKIFFATSGDDMSAVTVTSAPYPDVPMDSSTSWFIKYVQFSKNHALVDADASGNFYPAAGMKRGDVAELFYRYDKAGL